MKDTEIKKALDNIGRSQLIIGSLCEAILDRLNTILEQMDKSPDGEFRDPSSNSLKPISSIVKDVLKNIPKKGNPNERKNRT